MLPEKDQDWLWIEEFRTGNEVGFRKIFDKYKSRAITLALRFVKNTSVAEDIAQDLFVKIYEKKTPSKPSGRFSTWLYQVVLNASIDYLRKIRFFGRSLDADSEPLEAVSQSPPAGQVASTNELNTLVHKEIDKLPEKLKLPLVLYQFEEMSYSDIAKILKISEKAVERRLYRARELLRSKLGGYF